MKFVIVLIFFLSALTSETANAQTMAEKIKAKSTEIAELKALLNSPDPATRIAAIDVMQNAEDKAMREMAYAVGINSSDEAVVALTIRNRFKEVKNFSVSLSIPEGSDEKLTAALQKYGEQVKFVIHKYDYELGVLNVSTNLNSSKYDSSISGSLLMLSSYYCNGTLLLNDELIFAGRLTCDKNTFDAKAAIF